MKRRPLFAVLPIMFLAIGGLIATLAAQWHPLLGLDLQGGASVVLQPVNKVDNKILDQTIGIIRSRVDALGVAEPDISRQGNAIVVQLPGVSDQERALRVVGQTAELRFRPVLGSLPSESEEKATAAANKTSTTTTAKPGSATTTVAAGSATTTVAAVSTTAAPGLVAAPAGGRGAFRVALEAVTTVPASPTSAAPTSASPTTTPAKASPTSTIPTAILPTTALAPTTGAGLATTPIDQDIAGRTVILPYQQRSPKAVRYLLGPAELTGEVVSDAQARIGNDGTWEVVANFNSAGSARWNAMANKYYQQRIAIVLDGIVKSAPTINAREFNGSASITGNFTVGEAKDLATVLRFGSLPVQLKPATVQTVSASLGRDSLRAGIITGAIGLFLVALYMVAYYRSLGLVVIMGLTMSAMLMWALVSLLSKTKGLALSLSGAVGIIVSVGITVDSYVVYFERMRDELRAGRSLRSAVDRGFTGAWHTIVSADATSLIGAFVLYLLTVGSVRGFAFFLMLSTALDLLVAYFFTRPLVALLGRTSFFTSGPLRVKEGPNIGRPVDPGSGGAGILTPGVAGSAKGGRS